MNEISFIIFIIEYSLFFKQLSYGFWLYISKVKKEVLCVYSYIGNVWKDVF